ncbi:FxsA family protein [Egibacter rhizosphaerae]|uniref:FxsA family protein n=1 Tax=Egibacter rhizosphaerae TaxID=1670831 RepID=UPI0013F159A6|nr:FxsA family protein [Egibacter rhizosphaerae]
MRAILFLVFVVGPILELLVIIQVGQLVGPWPTVGLLLAVSVLGALLVRREGLKAWQRFTRSLQEGRVPAAEVVDGALLLLGGAFLVTPGFITDALGLALLFPPTRAGLRRLVRARSSLFVAGATGLRGAQSSPRGGRARPHDTNDVVDVEVVRVEREDAPEASEALEDGHRDDPSEEEPPR